jgi:hypothetical protein
MSVALTDILLELADPASLTRFNRDRNAYLEGTSLNQEDKDCLLAGDLSRIFLNARSVESDDPDQQFNRYHANEPLIEIDPVVELHLANDQITAAGAGMRFIDENGLLYRAVLKSN